MKYVTLLISIILFAVSPVSAQVQLGESGTLSGRVFSDYYWFASHHDDAVEGQNGFWFRRVYLTYDREISESFTSRVRLEMSSEGDFLTNAKMSPVVKDLYLRWQNDFHQVTAGLTSTPTWGLVEDVWGYRSVEKTPLDLFDFGSSRDIGLSVRGQFDEQGTLEYQFMIGNGNSNRTELNKGKKVMLSLAYHVTEHIVGQVYGDWNSLPNEVDIITIQGFLAYRAENMSAGLLYAHQKRTLPLADLDLDLASVFTNFRLSETAKGFFRVDHSFNPVPGIGSNDYIPINSTTESTFMVGGVDMEVGPDIHLIPNIETIVYGEGPGGTTPSTDLIPRLTLFYRF